MPGTGAQPLDPTAKSSPEVEENAATVSAVPVVPTAALDAFARQHRSFLQAMARKLCRDQVDPDDLVQDVLERALKAFARLPPGAEPRAWLTRIMHNRFIDLVRRLHTQPSMQPYEDQHAAEPPEPSPAWERITVEDVQAKVAELPPHLREAYECHEVLKLSYTESAARLKIPTGTVGTRLLHARRRLRKLLLADAKDETHD